MPGYIVFMVNTFLGFILAHLFSHPRSRINKKLPVVQIKFFQILPCMRIKLKGKIIHVHHWVHFSLLLVISLTLGSGILDATYTKGFLLGGILQGLRYPDWKKIYD